MFIDWLVSDSNTVFAGAAPVDNAQPIADDSAQVSPIGSVREIGSPNVGVRVQYGDRLAGWVDDRGLRGCQTLVNCVRQITALTLVVDAPRSPGR